MIILRHINIPSRFFGKGARPTALWRMYHRVDRASGRYQRAEAIEVFGE